jgi:hypothetical protein
VSAAAAGLWPWLALVGLGVFHGVNPAMGWLFAVALALQRRSRRIMLLAWVPIAAGHVASVALVVAAALALGLVLDAATLRRGAAAILIGWAVWHAVRGHKQRLRFGLQTGLLGLALWSFLMASAHGAGLMLIPVLLPICLSGGSAHAVTSGSLPLAAAALGLHSVAMLATMTAVSIIVHDRVGLAVLRSGWINLDLVWVAALFASGALVLLL